MEGDPEAGLTLLEERLSNRPSDAQLLNDVCWYRGAWQVDIDGAVAVCTRAIESSSFSAPSLDSRAMVHLREGRLEDALKDLDAALVLAPDQGPSLLLRGIVLREMGERAAGTAAIADALAREPSLRLQYSQYGFDL